MHTTLILFRRSRSYDEKKLFFGVASMVLLFGAFNPAALAEESESINSSIDIELMDEETLREIENLQRKELREIWDDYQVEVEEDEMQLMNTPIPDYSGLGNRGDILIALDSLTDHVGIVKDSYTVIEAHPDNYNGKEVGYRDNNWKLRYKKIKGLQVSGATVTQKANAVSYAEKQIGKPYTLATTHWTEDKWYCSKLVWRSWYNQGYDIEGRNGEPRGTHVTPGDILDSPLTSVFYSN